MTITNNDVGVVAINRVFVYWIEAPVSQKLDKLLHGGNTIWNISDTDAPSDIPAEGSFMNSTDRSFPDPLPRDFVVQFQDPLQSGKYEVFVVFDIGCQVSRSINIP